MATAVRDPRVAELVSANQKLLDQSIRHAVALERFKASVTRDISRLLNDQVMPELLLKIERRLSRIASRGFDVSLSSLKGLQELTASVDGTLQVGARLVHGKLRDELSGLAITEADWQIARLRGAVAPLELDFTTPAPATLRSVVTSRPFQGRLLRDHVRVWSNAQRRAVRQQLQLGLVQGETTQQIARRLTAPGGTFAIGRRQAETVTRTAVNHVTSHARQATYQENDDVIKGIQWISTLDSRVSQICLSLDGRVFPVDSGPRPPAHLNCRSDTAPVLKSWKELGIDLDEAPEGTRASMDGQVPGKLTAGEWLKRQPRSVQDEVLGPGKAKLFREGKIDARELTNQRLRPLTLEELRAKEGLPPKRTISSPSRPSPTPPPGQKIREWSDSLSDAEREAIEEWTGGGFRPMREIQLGLTPRRVSISGADLPRLQRLTRELENAVDKAPEAVNRDLWRVINVSDEDARLFSNVGHVIEFDSFQSFSKNVGNARELLRRQGQGVRFRLRSRKGADIDASGLSAFPEEAEVLFNRGGRFRVKSVTERAVWRDEERIAELMSDLDFRDRTRLDGILGDIDEVTGFFENRVSALERRVDDLLSKQSADAAGEIQETRRQLQVARIQVEDLKSGDFIVSNERNRRKTFLDVELEELE